MVSPDEFERHWSITYPDVPPVGYMLREKYPERWLRIHTLPESKRYPTSEEEYAEILRRHRTLLEDIIGPTSFVLVLTGYSETPLPVLSSAWLQSRYPDSRPFATHKMNGEAGSECYWHFFMVMQTWAPFAYDDLLRLVADDVLADVLFVRLDIANIYAPYDGGADIIVSSSSARDAMRQRYASWLSVESSGL